MIVYLHIGTPKSGTSYLQSLLEHNRDTLAADGILWPGRNWSDQVLAVRELLNAHQHGHRPPEVEGAWRRLVDEIHGHDGHAAIVSMEWLVQARPRHVQAVVDALAPHEVRVLITARDFARTVPSQWQESVQNWETWTWPAYLADVTSDEPRHTVAGRRLLNQHDLGPLLRTWGTKIPSEAMYVVPLPPPGSAVELLWHRFARALDVDPGHYAAPPRPGNGSLGAASAEVMRRVNLGTRDRGMKWVEGDRILKQVLAKSILAHRARVEPRPSLPPEYHEWATQHAKRITGDVAALGVPVIGDLHDLMPADPTRVDEQDTGYQIADAAVDGLAGLATTMGEELARLRSDIESATRERDSAIRERDSAVQARDAARAIVNERRGLPPVERVKRCAPELAGQLRTAHLLLTAYRRARSIGTRARLGARSRRG